MVWCLHIYFRMISVPDSPLLSSVFFFLFVCLFFWQALTQPQGSAASAMVWHGLQRAAFSQQQAKGYFKFLFENHPSGSSPHLEDVGLSWDWVINTIDGEDNRGQDIDGKTWNIVLLEREGERLALEILLVRGDWEWPWGMILHLGTPWHGADELLYVIEKSSWAKDQWCPGVHKGLAATRTSNNLSFHGNAERQWKKRASTSLWVSPELPSSRLCPKQPFVSCPFFLCSRYGTFLDILECSTWIHQALLHLDTSWSYFLEELPPLWLENFFSSSRFQLSCHGFREVFPPVFISLFSWQSL